MPHPDPTALDRDRNRVEQCPECGAAINSARPCDHQPLMDVS